MNGKEREKDAGVKYDFGILELEEDLSEKHGFLGIDTREVQIKEVKKV